MVFTHLQRFVYTPGKSALLFTTPHCQLWNTVAFTISEAQYWVLRYISAQWEFIFRKHRHDPDVTFITHHSNKNAGLHMPCMALITLCMARALTNATGEWHGAGRGGGSWYSAFLVPRRMWWYKKLKNLGTGIKPVIGRWLILELRLYILK